MVALFLIFSSFFVNVEAPDCSSKQTLSEVVALNVSPISHCSSCIELSYRNESTKNIHFFRRDVSPLVNYLGFEVIFEDDFWFKYPESSVYSNPLSELNVPGYYDLIALKPYESISIKVDLSGFYLTEGRSCFLVRNEFTLINPDDLSTQSFETVNSNKVCL